MQESQANVKTTSIHSKENEDERLNDLMNRFAYHSTKLLSEMNKTFIINKQNNEVIETLMYYFSHHSKFLESKNIISGKPNFNKGILLMGNVGSGKTLLMEIFKRCVSQVTAPFMDGQKSFSTIYAKDLPYLVESEGLAAMKKYTEKYIKLNGATVNNIINIEDIGAEKKEKHMNYGSQYDLIDHLIDVRNRLCVYNNIATHCTTNLDAKALLALYDERFVSRLYDTFNIILVGSTTNSIDFRKL